MNSAESTLHFIYAKSFIYTAFWYCIKTETRIRLAGGNVSNAGRLEVYIAGTWGTVRNQGWNNVTSNVACRELGYQRANSTILSAVGTFGKGEGPVWMSGLNCTGSEDSLWECPWSRIAGIYWDHDNDVGLICEGIIETGRYTCYIQFRNLQLSITNEMSNIPFESNGR